jgi:hypothetical protein
MVSKRIADSVTGPTSPAEALASFPLIDAIVSRRSRRFALGNRLQGGALSYASGSAPVPLAEAEQAVLAFSASGVTGYALADMPYQPGAGPETGGGNIMVTLLGRAVSSPDAAHTSVLFMLDDAGTYLMRRPQDFPRDEIEELAKLARERRFVELYRRSRVRVRDGRTNIAREVPFTPPFNKWSTNLPGATYFVPVIDVTALYMTILFGIFGEEFAYFIYDDRKSRTTPAGIQRFARSRGGHLYDDPNDGRVGTIQEVETYILELCSIEQGLMVQNLMLATEALGLGGFPHYGAHRYAWPQSFGFRMRERTLAQLMRKGLLGTLVLELLRKNIRVPQAVGYEFDGRPFVKPFCPPYYPTMEAAVHSFVASKYAPGSGIFRDSSRASAWRDPAAVQAQVPEYSQKNIDAVVGYCEYIQRNYGQFPGNFGPVRTVIAYQAHHIDTAFYDRFYREGSYTDAHAGHFELWHQNRSGGR